MGLSSLPKTVHACCAAPGRRSHRGISPVFARPFTITPSPHRRRTVGWLSLVVYFAAAFGLPVPETLAAGPFPCQFHGCGCRSADQCWRSCCCYSVEEKLAWAHRHGVTPPDFVAEAVPAGDCCSASQTTTREPALSDRSHRRNCCSTELADVCEDRLAEADAGAPPVANQCCSTAPSSQGHHAPRQRGGVEWAPGFNVLQCQGLGSAWMAIIDVIAPPPPVLEYQVSLPFCGRLTASGPLLSTLAHIPATPPG